MATALGSRRQPATELGTRHGNPAMRRSKSVAHGRPLDAAFGHRLQTWHVFHAPGPEARGAKRWALRRPPEQRARKTCTPLGHLAISGATLRHAALQKRAQELLNPRPVNAPQLPVRSLGPRDHLLLYARASDAHRVLQLEKRAFDRRGRLSSVHLRLSASQSACGAVRRPIYSK